MILNPAYECRSCGKVFVDSTKEIIVKDQRSATDWHLGIDDFRHYFLIGNKRVVKHLIHQCDDKTLGIAELIDLRI
jgi:hypothetical protein